MSQRRWMGACLCCGYRTGCTTCPICFWTADGRLEAMTDAILDGPNGDLSLTEARLNFAVYGACQPRYQDLVRPPRPEERPPTGTIYRSRSAPPEVWPNPLRTPTGPQNALS